MKKRNILSILALVGFTILGFIFLKGRTHELAKLLEVDLKYVLIIFIFVILASLLRGHKLKMMMNFYGIKLKFKEWWGLQVITNWGNQLIPLKGGLSTRVVYFKKKYNFPYTSSAIVIIMSYLIDFLIFGLLGTILSFFLPVSNEVKYSVLIFFVIVFLGIMAILFIIPSAVFLPLSKRINIKVLRRFASSVGEFQQIKTEYKLLFGLVFNVLGRVVIGTSRLFFAFRAFDFAVSFHTCMIIDLLLSIAIIISITPMNLGFRESIVVLSSKLFAIGSMLGAFVAALDRAVALVWIFISAPIFSYILFKDFKIKKEIQQNVYIPKK